jgi:hypothetical protein
MDFVAVTGTVNRPLSSMHTCQYVDSVSSAIHHTVPHVFPYVGITAITRVWEHNSTFPVPCTIKHILMAKSVLQFFLWA